MRDLVPDESLAPIFVVGNPRSGTTLLRLVLTSHSQISIPPESEFIVRLFPKYGHIKLFDESAAYHLRRDLGGGILDLAEQWEVPLEDLVGDLRRHFGKTYAQVCSSIYRAYQVAKGLEPKRLWGDKNNAYGNYLDVLTYLYPTARFVHIVRDGRAVLNSYRLLDVPAGQRYAPRLPKDVRDVAFHWTDTVGRIDRHLTRYASGRHVTVRYENIISDFESEIGRLCAFLGLEYETEMQDFYKRNAENNLEPRKYSWKENTFRPIDAKRGDAWRDSLDASEAAEFEAEAASTLRRYGYALDFRPRRPNPRVSLLGMRSGAKIRETLRGLRLRLVACRAALGV